MHFSKTSAKRNRLWRKSQKGKKVSTRCHRLIYGFHYNCHHICHLFSVLLSYLFLLLSTYALGLHKFCLALAGRIQNWSLLTPINDNRKICVAMFTTNYVPNILFVKYITNRILIHIKTLQQDVFYLYFTNAETGPKRLSKLPKVTLLIQSTELKPRYLSYPKK